MLRLTTGRISPGHTALKYDPKINPSNAKTTFVQSTMTQISKNNLTLSCWYSLDSSHCVLSGEYPYTRVSFFLHHFLLAKLAITSIRAKKGKLVHPLKTPHIYIASQPTRIGVDLLVMINWCSYPHSLVGSSHFCN